MRTLYTREAGLTEEKPHHISMKDLGEDDNDERYEDLLEKEVANRVQHDFTFRDAFVRYWMNFCGCFKSFKCYQSQCCVRHDKLNQLHDLAEERLAKELDVVEFINHARLTRFLTAICFLIKPRDHLWSCSTVITYMLVRLGLKRIFCEMIMVISWQAALLHTKMRLTSLFLRVSSLLILLMQLTMVRSMNPMKSPRKMVTTL